MEGESNIFNMYSYFDLSLNTFNGPLWPARAISYISNLLELREDNDASVSMTTSLRDGSNKIADLNLKTKYLSLTEKNPNQALVVRSEQSVPSGAGIRKFNFSSRRR